MINKKAVAIALLVAFGAAWLVYAALKGGSSLFGGGSAEGREVYVAAVDILQRQAVNEAMFIRQKVPQAMFHPNMVTEFDPKVAVYAVTALSRGEILYRDKLGPVDQEPELSYMVDWNQGCVTIHINDATGVSGLIKPGDYVDVYATFKAEESKDDEDPPPNAKSGFAMTPVESSEGPSGRGERSAEDKSLKVAMYTKKLQEVGKLGHMLVPAVTRRILRNMRVVATDNEVLPSVGVRPFNIPRAPGPAGRVTLAGKVHELEKLILAYNSGQLHLALVSDASVKKAQKAKSDTEFLQIECVRGDQSEVVYVER